MKSIDTIYTYSNYRMNAINKWFNGELKKQIIPVGPYILYADHFKSSSKLMQIKSKLGRVLLVFPSHPAPGALTEYDVEAFLHEVDSVAQNYDSVLVSLFWLDVRRGYDKPYIKRGYKVVCSGVRTDRWFLSRQKDLFSLADFSMSNDVGTHIGYSIAMGVPHYVFKQKVTINGGGAEFSFEKFNLIRSKEYNEIIEEFGSKEAIISSRQREIVEYYWGKTINDE